MEKTTSITSYLFLFGALLFTNLLLAQLQITDSITAAPVPYARIRLAGSNEGTITDYDGYFDPYAVFKTNDSILISCIGYETKGYRLKNNTSSNRITLLPVSQQLEEVTIQQKKGKFVRKVLGITKDPKTMFFDHNITANNGTIRAFYIPNEYSIPGILKNVQVYITDKGYPDAHFRVHIYNVSPLEIKPDTELTTSNRIASGTTGNEWLQIDLSSERIVIPENGCFVGIEWFDHPKSHSFSDTMKVRGVTYSNGQTKDTLYAIISSGNGVALGSRDETYKIAKNKLWYKTDATDKWINWCAQVTDESKFYIADTLGNGNIFIRNENNTYFSVPCIHIEMTLPKEKVDLKLEDPPKRKLNQFEKVKENNFLYPQSSVTELFNSLIKAFENDDLIYVLRFLCVYPEDGLESIINDLETNQQTTGSYLSEEDKIRIITHLRQILNTLTEDALTKVSSHQFELSINDERYDLIVEDGKWKISPYSYRIMK